MKMYDTFFIVGPKDKFRDDKNLSMSIAKEAAKKLIELLPDNATWDDILYELYVKKKLALALKAAEEGHVISHNKVKVSKKTALLSLPQ
jgi:hypothetical protein